jgi:hypothetical protein
VEGVTGGSQLDAIVLHSPGFRVGSMLRRAQTCWAVMKRLVGIMSATTRPRGIVTKLSLGVNQALRPRPEAFQMAKPP